MNRRQRSALGLAWAVLSALGVGGCRSLPPPTPPLSPTVRLVPTPPGGPVIVARPIPFGPERRRLTLDYIRRHYDEEAAGIGFTPRMIVLHAAEIPTFEGLQTTFAPDAIAASRPEIAAAGVLNVSAHFGVDLDGTVYQFLPPTVVARHVIGLNRVAIGVENVGSALPGAAVPLTAAQVEADVALVRYLVARFPTIRYLIGHSEYGRFRGTPLWQERDPSYMTEKSDPGDEFMRQVRARVEDLLLRDHFSPGDF